MAGNVDVLEVTTTSATVRMDLKERIVSVRSQVYLSLFCCTLSLNYPFWIQSVVKLKQSVTFNVNGMSYRP